MRPVLSAFLRLHLSALIRPFLHRDPAVRIIGKGVLRIVPCIIFGILHILTMDITRIL